MCATKCEGPFKAKEDIICYKDVTPLERDSLNGRKFTAKLHGKTIEGVISYEGGSIFLCQNTNNGCDCSNKHGYQYSWFLDASVTELVIEDFEPTKFITPYRLCKVELGHLYRSRVKPNTHPGGPITIDVGLHSFVSPFRSGAFSVSVECIIPKGSTYYKGLFGVHPCYVSTRLKYIKVHKG